MQPRDIVITGLGVVGPLGVGREAMAAALEAGRSGIVPLPEFAGSELPFRFGGKLADFDAKEYVQPRKSLKVMSSEIQAACAAAILATRDARLDKGAGDSERFGVVLGSELLFGEPQELLDCYRNVLADQAQHNLPATQAWGQHAMHDLFPLWMLKYLPNMAACHIGIAQDARGPNNSIVLGGASSLVALLEAASYIQRGLADVMLAGGSGSQLAISALSYRGHQHCSHWTGDPAEACKPFDARRDGGVLAEGAGVLVLETREHAQRRGATILARLAGGARGYEADLPDQPRSGRAIRRTIRAALEEAGVTAGDLQHVGASASGAIVGDRLEAQAIRAELGDAPVTALKSFQGEMGAGSGAVELIGSLLALSGRVVPPTLNYREPDPTCPVNVVRAPLASDRPALLKLSQSATGQAAAVVLVRED